MRDGSVDGANIPCKGVAVLIRVRKGIRVASKPVISCRGKLEESIWMRTRGNHIEHTSNALVLLTCGLTFANRSADDERLHRRFSIVGVVNRSRPYRLR